MQPTRVLEEKERRPPSRVAHRWVAQFSGRRYPEGEQGFPVIIRRDESRLLIPKLPFQRLLKDICYDFKSDLRVDVKALSILHHAAEAHLVGLFADALLCAEHRDKQTVEPRDLRIASKIRGDWLRDKLTNDHAKTKDVAYQYNEKYERQDGFINSRYNY